MAWRAHLPHATDRIREIKKSLQDGTKEILRHRRDTARDKQGHQVQKRCAKDGMALIVIPVHDESDNLDKRIVSEKFAYIARNGENRPLYAPVSEYQIPPPMTSVATLTNARISGEEEAMKSTVSSAQPALTWGRYIALPAWICMDYTTHRTFGSSPVRPCGYISIIVGRGDSWVVYSGLQWVLRALEAHGLAGAIQVSQDVVANDRHWLLLSLFIMWKSGAYIYDGWISSRPTNRVLISSQSSP